MQLPCIKMRYSIKPRDTDMDMDFCLLLKTWVDM